MRPKVRLFVRPQFWAGWGFMCPYCNKKVLCSVEDLWNMGVSVDEFKKMVEFMCPHCKNAVKFKWGSKPDGTT